MNHTSPLRIIITGATGKIGRILVPLLAGNGCDLLLVGRSAYRLAQAFPDKPCCTYDELGAFAKGYDVTVHLAVMNNNKLEDLDAFEKANVELTLEVAKQCNIAGVQRFVFVSSVHALDTGNLSLYAQTKRKALAFLQACGSRQVEVLYLPYIYSDGFAGKLQFLDALPIFIKPKVFRALAAFRPTLHISKLAAYIASSKTPSHSMILSDGQSDNKLYQTFKRMMDFGFAFGVIFVFWWLLILIWAAIKLNSSGPGFFVQTRVGKNGIPFKCYKFRTMKTGTPERGTHETPQSAITSIGHFLRGTKLDELPQIWNIWRNEISLIGPRPCLPVQKDLIAHRSAFGVFDIKPGITGFAQVEGLDMSEPQKLAEMDARYIALQSIFLDLKILASTFFGNR